MDSSITQEASFSFAGSGAGHRAHVRAARRLGNAIFFALLALIALTAIPYGTVQPQWEAAFECFAFALVALWIVEGWLGGVWHVRGRRLLVPLLLIVVFAFVQTLPLGSTSAIAGIEGWRASSADPYE